MIGAFSSGGTRNRKSKILPGLSASIYASRLLDKYLVLKPFTILIRQTTSLTLVTLVHFRHFSPLLFTDQLLSVISQLILASC